MNIKEQCESVARVYKKFREDGETRNDLIETPVVKKLIDNVKGKKVLDAGCGYGYYSKYFSE